MDASTYVVLVRWLVVHGGLVPCCFGILQLNLSIPSHESGVLRMVLLCTDCYGSGHTYGVLHSTNILN